MRPADCVLGHHEFEGLPEGSRSGKHVTGRPPDDGKEPSILMSQSLPGSPNTEAKVQRCAYFQPEHSSHDTTRA